MDRAKSDSPQENTNEFSEPLMDQDGVSHETKLRGIIVQTIADLGAQHSFDDIAKVVQQRRIDSKLDYSAAQTHELLRTVIKEAAAAADADGA